jgi:hypothetical protein
MLSQDDFVIVEHDCSTGEVTTEPMSMPEIDKILKERAKEQEEIAAEQKIVEDRRAARAKILERIGLTEDEAKVLLG